MTDLLVYLEHRIPSHKRERGLGPSARASLDVFLHGKEAAQLSWTYLEDTAAVKPWLLAMEAEGSRRHFDRCCELSGQEAVNHVTISSAAEDEWKFGK